MPSPVSAAWNTVCDKLELKNPFKKQGTVLGYSNWKRITVTKETNHGTYIFNNVIDESTGDVYNLNICMHGPYIRRFKAVEYAVATPFYALGTMAYNLVKVIYVVAKYAVIFFYHVGTREEDRSIKKILSKDLKKMGEKVGRCFANVIRSPYYAAGVFVGNLLMIIEPINGDKFVHKFEKEWNHGLDLDRLVGPTGMHLGENYKLGDPMVLGYCYCPVTTLSELNADPYATYEIAEPKHPFLHFAALSLWG